MLEDEPLPDDPIDGEPEDEPDPVEPVDPVDPVELDVCAHTAGASASETAAAINVRLIVMLLDSCLDGTGKGEFPGNTLASGIPDRQADAPKGTRRARRMPGPHDASCSRPGGHAG